MTPGSAGRFCGHCQRTVHDLSSMSSAEVDDLICLSAGQLCVRYQPGPDGRVLTLDYQPQLPAKRRWPLWSVPLAIGGIFAALFGHAMTQTQVMGAVRCLPVPATQPGSTTQPADGGDADSTEEVP
jgi:hypothetical protein